MFSGGPNAVHVDAAGLGAAFPLAARRKCLAEADPLEARVLFLSNTSVTLCRTNTRQTKQESGVKSCFRDHMKVQSVRSEGAEDGFIQGSVRIRWMPAKMRG